MDKKVQDYVWEMLQATTLGYNSKKDSYGVLFSNIIISGYIPGIDSDENLFN